MGFPIILPTIVKELTAELKPIETDEFCDIIVSPAAVEYVPHMSNPAVARKLIEAKDILAFSMVNLPDEQSEQFEKQSQIILKEYPSAQYYWQIRTLMMSILQDRSINFEKRFLLLNYAIKTVQGMIDKGQPNLIPPFISEFTQPNMDFTPVLEYFKEIRPNPGYSLADGISLLKSLKKPNAAYKEVMNTIYKNLGVSGPETLKMADMKEYISLRKEYSEMVSGEKASCIENIMINLLWAYSIPFADSRFNFWDHFVFFCSLYNAVKVMVTCYMPGKDEEALIKAVSAFDEALRATGKDIIDKVIAAVKNAGQGNNGDMAVLTLS